MSEANLTPLRPGQAEESFEGNPGPTTTKSRGAATSQSQSTSIPESFLDNMNGEVMMASLRNKNKRKNFRQTMVAPAVRKIVFGVTGDAYLTASTSIQESNSAGLVTRESRELPENSNVVSTVSSLQTRIIPPSKLAALGLLPSNILVTSVEFGRQGKKKNRRSWDPCKEEQVVNKVQQFDWYGHDADNGNVYLPYGEDGDGQGDTVEQSAQFDWRAAETGWEHFSLIETQDQLYSGVLVCWQVRLSSTSAKVPNVKYFERVSPSIHKRSLPNICSASGGSCVFIPGFTLYTLTIQLGKSGGYLHYHSTNIKARDRNCRGVRDCK